MADFRARRHRLELPPLPNSDDPAVLKRAMDQMKRLVQDEFNRLSTDFYRFKQDAYNAAILPLRAPANIEVTFGQYSMSATWELPDGDEVTPTHVRVRILEISDTWAEYPYPKTSWSFSGLDPGTQYTFQVQLVARFEAQETFVSSTRVCPSVPVLRVAESDVKSKVFTTDEGVGPPEDAGTNDENVDFNFPNTDGTPGSVGGSDCWWGYKFQYRTACAWADTAVSEAFAAGNVGDVTIDTGAAPFTTYPDTVFRLAYREICNGVPQDWVYTEPFMAVDFSDADCLGISKSASLSESPFDTADLFAIPSVCQEDGTWLQIVDALSDTELTPMEPGFKCIEYIDNEWTLLADDTSDTAISNVIYTGLLTGTIAGIDALNDNSDFTLAFDVKVADNALVSAGGTGAYTLLNIGGGKIRIQMIQNTSVYALQVVVARDGGGSYVFRADDLPYATWISLYYLHDVSEADGRKLYINSILQDESANALPNDFDGIDNTIFLYTVNDMQVRKVYGWSSLVVPTAEGIGAGMLAGGQDTTGAGQDDIFLVDLDSDTWSTASSTLTNNVSDPCPLSETGTYAWIVGGLIQGGAARDTVDRWLWSTATLSSGTARPSASRGGSGLDNPGTAGYQCGNVSNGDVYKMIYSSETWSDTGQNISAGSFPQGVASNWGTAGYVFGRDGSNRYNKFVFSTEIISTLTGGYAGTSVFRPTGMSHQGTAMYSLGGNGNDDMRKVTYASDTGSATTSSAVLSNDWIGNYSGSIGDSPTRGIAAGGFNDATNDETNQSYQVAFSTDTVSTFTTTGLNARDSAAQCSAM